MRAVTEMSDDTNEARIDDGDLRESLYEMRRDDGDVDEIRMQLSLKSLI